MASGGDNDGVKISRMFMDGYGYIQVRSFETQRRFPTGQWVSGSTDIIGYFAGQSNLVGECNLI